MKRKLQPEVVRGRASGQFWGRIRSGNGEIVWWTEPYHRIRTALNAANMIFDPKRMKPIRYVRDDGKPL